MEIGQQKLRDYLLGRLPEDLAEEIDLEIISNEGLEEELVRAEDELVEDYLDETLTPEDLELFNRNFLISDARRESLFQTRLLRQFAQTTGRAQVSDLSENRTGFFGFNWPTLRLAFSAGVAVIIVFAIWQLANRPGALEREIAELNKSELTDASLQAGTFQLNLASGSLRSDGDLPAVGGEQLSDIVLIRLALPRDDRDRTFETRMTSKNETIFKLDGMHAMSNSAGKELRIMLPKSALQKGTYKIDVLDDSSGDQIGEYLFEVK